MNGFLHLGQGYRAAVRPVAGFQTVPSLNGGLSLSVLSSSCIFLKSPVKPGLFQLIVTNSRQVVQYPVTSQAMTPPPPISTSSVNLHFGFSHFNFHIDPARQMAAVTMKHAKAVNIVFLIVFLLRTLVARIGELGSRIMPPMVRLMVSLHHSKSSSFACTS